MTSTTLTLLTYCEPTDIEPPPTSPPAVLGENRSGRPGDRIVCEPLDEPTTFITLFVAWEGFRKRSMRTRRYSNVVRAVAQALDRVKEEEGHPDPQGSRRTARAWVDAALVADGTPMRLRD